ncbi:hypothetical protein R83H12_00563 [Fibrobacteria bacterium R8-3-H12]
MRNILTKNTHILLILIIGVIWVQTITSCSGDDGGGDTPSSSSEPATSSSNGVSSSSSDDSGDSSSSAGGGVAIPPAVVSVVITFDSISTTVDADKIYILGLIAGTKNSPIEILEFEPAGWVEYTGSLPQVYISLGTKASIDLTNKDIPCGYHYVAAMACIKIEGQPNKCPDCCANQIGYFDKPESYCVSSSSVGASSSAGIEWKFGNMETQNIAGEASQITISGAIKFNLSVFNNGLDVNVTMASNSYIIELHSPTWLEDSTPAGYPLPGKGYSNSLFRDRDPQKNVLGITAEDYYLVLSGSTRYLIRFEPIEGAWTEFPLKVLYWPVTQSPDL